MEIYWRIDKGIYQASTGKFVSEEEAPFEQIFPLYVDRSSPESLKLGGAKELREEILFKQRNGYPAVLAEELKTRFEKIRDIQELYDPELKTLQEAFTSAMLLAKEEEAAELKQEYQDLLQEMQQKIQEVPLD